MSRYFLLIVLIGSLATAQTPAGRIAGVVRDPSGMGEVGRVSERRPAGPPPVHRDVIEVKRVARHGGGVYG